MDRHAFGNTGYRLYERGGKRKESAGVFADGRCKYNGEVCAPDDPRLPALIAQVAPVEVRPAAPAPHPLLGPPLAPHLPLAAHSPPSNRPMDQAGSFWPPQALAKTVATEVHPHAARRRWWPCGITQQPPHCTA